MSDVASINNGVAANGVVHAVTEEEVVLICPVCPKLPLADDRFDYNNTEKRKSKLILEENYVVLVDNKNRLPKEGKRSRDAKARLNIKFCRFHHQFDMDTDLRNKGCPKVISKDSNDYEAKCFCDESLCKIIKPSNFQTKLS